MGIKGLWSAFVGKEYEPTPGVVYVVDSSILIYRIWHALSTMIKEVPAKYTMKDIEAVFTRNMMAYIDSLKPKENTLLDDIRFIFVFDGPQPLNKVHRIGPNAPPDNIWALFASNTIGIGSTVKADFEADGIVGSLCQWIPNSIAVSNDSDIFYYGAQRVLTSNGLLYDLDYNLERLEISLMDFYKICHMSGNDYNGSFKSFDKKLIDKYDGHDTLPPRFSKEYADNLLKIVL
jgi:5'-3' exonuclease